MKDKFKPPTLELVHEMGSSMGLPERECEKLWSYFESVGWVIGRSRKPAKSLRGLMATWKLNWQDRQDQGGKASPTAILIEKRHQLDECVEKIKHLKGQMPFEKGSVSAIQFNSLVMKRDNLKKSLEAMTA